MVADVLDYEAFYRLWLPIELGRGMGGMEGARNRAHARAVEECELMPDRHVNAAEVAIAIPVNGKKKRGV